MTESNDKTKKKAHKRGLGIFRLEDFNDCLGFVLYFVLGSCENLYRQLQFL